MPPRQLANRRCCSCMAHRWPHSRRSISACRAARIRRSWIGSPDAGSDAGASIWKAMADRTSIATSTAISPTAPMIWRPSASTSWLLATCADFWSMAFHPEPCARPFSHSAIRSASRALRSMHSSGQAPVRPPWSSAAKKLPEFLAAKRRPIDRAFIHSIFERDHPDCAAPEVVDAFADAILALDD